MALGTQVGPAQASPGLPGGASAWLNITAAQIVKSAPGILYRLIPTNVGTGGALTVNDANGLVATQTITGISVATNAVVTYSASSQQFAVGNTCVFASVVGMTQINGLVGTITGLATVVSSSSYSITTNIDSSGFTAYSSGGTVATYGAANQVTSFAYDATGVVAGLPLEFDWPCAYGIVISAVPSGSSVYSVSYT
jgi:hypothetical protein